MTKQNHSDSRKKTDSDRTRITVALLGLVGVIVPTVITVYGQIKVKTFEIHASQTAEYALVQNTTMALTDPNFSSTSMNDLPNDPPTDTPTATLTTTTTCTATSTLTPTATFTPTPVPISFQNFEEANGSCIGPGCYFWDAFYMNCSFETRLVREGQRSIKCDAHASRQKSAKHGGTLGVNPATDREPIDLSAATTISIWIYDSIGGNNAELKIRYYGNDGREMITDGVYSSPTNPTAIGTWTEVSWELAEFGIFDRSRIKNIEIYVYNDGTYYFDDITYR